MHLEGKSLSREVFLHGVRGPVQGKACGEEQRSCMRTRFPARLGPDADVVVMVISSYRILVLTSHAMIAAAWPPKADAMAAP